MSHLNKTIKDVAKHANVSVATVSRVLNNLDRVSDKTRKKVKKAIEELQFVPNSLAASMITKQTKMIATIVPNIQNSFYTSVIQATADVAKAEGYFTFVFPTNDSVEEEEAFFQGVLSKNVEGIVLVGTQTNPDAYKTIDKQIVLVDRYIENSGLDGVVIDNFRGAYEATTHMIEKGHTDIAILSGPTIYSNWKERYWGYQQALKDHGIKANPAYMKEGNWQEDSGYEMTLNLMRMDQPPTAIFATSYILCTYAINAIRDMNLVIGEDISLVGFDENDLAQFIRPKVTVVRRPTYEMGTHAATMLINKLKHKNKLDPHPKKLTLSVELLKNGSVKDLK
ncbi:LacI family transcriptional regulator [Alkalihalobacillus oceani]|uniref:LacI family transcriptional regulator n=1 Tax=Halalkalibacter oceani TaxID=1653776 RepID=A0A9X2DRX1_9BACI|nr:LacI family DNA-binding transcriptional regulator [Halalkalibacter oceani]MCM3715307.1 LacI family transcriptional regulator [Halalkalibacter oceani]